METIKEILGGFIEAFRGLWDRFKWVIILVLAVLILLATVPRVIAAIQSARANRTPVTAIEAVNEKTYKPGDTIRESDFKVTAIHEDGKKSKVKADQIKISRTDISVIGETTKVTIALIDDEDISCDVEVKNSRKVIREFACGFPDENALKAVLYSNGELSFQGEGTVRDFTLYPWKDYEEKDDYPITAVTFEKKVLPQHMDEWFSGIRTLTYIDPIPASVQSMRGTFSDCTSLEKGVNWGNCTRLVDISSTYEGCTSLVSVPAIPKTVKAAAHLCEGCAALKECPDMSQAMALEDMASAFSGCINMTTIEIPEKAVNLESAFEECINLTEMPTIPSGVVTMANCFRMDSAMRTLTNIPATVLYANGCFEGCVRAEGSLTIDATLEEFSGMFTDVARSSTLDVRGSGGNLNDIVWSSQNPNITVNGAPAVDPDTTAQEPETTQAP